MSAQLIEIITLNIDNGLWLYILCLTTSIYTNGIIPDPLSKKPMYKTF